jgi:HPt (histidine-containing phosphotransfer) domain-containing protein
MAAISTAGMPKSGVVNWRVALHSVSGDRELLKAVVETFLVETPRLVEQLHTALSGSDPSGVVQSAHTLKTSLNYFGIRRGFELALELERMGRQADLSGAEEALAALDGQMAQVISVLTEYERTGSTGGEPEQPQ